MDSEVRLKDVSEVLDELEYPIEQSEAGAELADVTLILADGSENFGDLVERTGSDVFESASDLEAELHNALPREAVGEPYQSEGDA
ncbi:DUF5789 family protein [Halobellus litoreus]|jgi:hypothetical protein|uniref:DUF2795 domain-containing protein n=1 Tax=Halobellus litoreus TaxID=755310 RepID=A0ABD6DWB8_9EURY|nr:hypothetical protein [Halobellus litoreus]